jgi:AhpD family alkylhydroperoxidase
MNTSRIFSIREQLRNIYYAAKGFVFLKVHKKQKIMNPALKERIMLAVTHVNGCAMCSFVHTKLALSSGMTDENIKELLDGDYKSVPQEDAVAVLFGQHFADSKEDPSEEAIERIIERYGIKKAEAILAACNMITMTNGMGISMDHFYKRLKFQRNRQSNILKEVLNPLLTMILFPLLAIGFFLKCMVSKIKILPRKYRYNQ